MCIALNPVTVDSWINSYRVVLEQWRSFSKICNIFNIWYNSTHFSVHSMHEMVPYTKWTLSMAISLYGQHLGYLTTNRPTCITGNIFGKTFNSTVSHYFHLFLNCSGQQETYNMMTVAATKCFPSIKWNKIPWVFYMKWPKEHPSVLHSQNKLLTVDPTTRG
jgi:hypothetical protein